MSENFLSGYHPDADQIAAFVEHALPAHEREQMLDHLAGCRECRAIVALSLPEVEEPAKPSPASARRPWWAGWGLAWPAAAAIAALSFMVLYVHHAAVAPAKREEAQVAVSPPPAAPAPRMESRAANPAKPVQVPTAKSSGGDRALAVGGPAARRSEVQLDNKLVDSAVLTGRDAAELIKMMPGASYSSAGAAGHAESFVASPTGSAAGNGYGQVAARNPSAPAKGRLDGLIPAPPAAAPIPSAQSASAAPNSPAQSPTSQSVTVISGRDAEVPVDNAEISASLNEEKVNEPGHPLPSKLPVLSMVAHGDLVVAIDTRNAVFASKDAGKHWAAIRAQWPGRAVKASLIEFQATRVAASGRNFAPIAGALQLSAADSSNKAIEANGLHGQSLDAAQKPSITGTVTDQSGAQIPGASLTVIDTLTGERRDTATDTAGHYIVVGLAPGTYRVEAHALGFATTTLASIAVAASGQSVANLSLKVSSDINSVTVISGADAEVPTSADSGDNEKLSPNRGADHEAAKKQAVTPAVSASPPALFEITTDSGDRWTSADAVTWTHR